VPVSSQEGERLCICVLGVSILPLSMILEVFSRVGILFLHVIQNNFSILQSVQKAMQNKPSLKIIIIELGWSP
jgi:hypothetical protein